MGIDGHGAVAVQAESFELWPDGELQEWYAVHTRSRSEKLVAAVLAAEQIPYYLPTVRLRKRWSDRYKYVTQPLFSGYLFVNIAIEERFRVCNVRGVAKLVGFDGKPYPVPHSEVLAVRKAMQMSPHADRYPGLPVGCEVEVTRGPLLGVRGILERWNGRHCLVLAVKLIAQAVVVEVDEADVARL